MAEMHIRTILFCEECGDELDCEIDITTYKSHDTIKINVFPCPRCMGEAEEHGAHVGYMRGRESMGGK